MSERSVWERIPALAVSTLLEELYAARLRTFEDGSRALPVLTVMTRSGHAITGQLLVYDTKSHDVVIEELATARVTADLTYLSASEIAAVRVQQALDAIDVVTRGEIELAPRSEVPALLEVRRETAAALAALSERLGRELELEVEWAPLADDAARRHSARLVFESFVNVLGALIDEFDTDALGAVSTVRIEDGEAIGAAVEGAALVLRADLGRGRRGRMTERALRGAIERAL